jgi:cobalt-zinc-cadmium efflux system protein
MESEATSDRVVSVRRESRMVVALWLNVAMVIVQVVSGLAARSLGLIADAGHNLTDVAAVLGSVVALRVARRPANARRSFGYHRATVIAAMANATSMLVVTAIVVSEAARRISHPAKVNGRLVVVVALGAALLNFVAVVVLRRGHAHAEHAAAGHDHPGHDHTDHNRPDSGGLDRDLNVRAVVLHLAGDVAASLGVALAGAVMAFRSGWYWLDPAVSIIVALLIGRQAWRLLRETLDVFLESTPPNFATDALVATMTSIAGVDEVHDIHVWSLASDVRALSAHVVLTGHPTLEEANVVGTMVKAAISAPFAIRHATLELESESCRDDGSWCALDDAASLRGPRTEPNYNEA